MLRPIAAYCYRALRATLWRIYALELSADSHALTASSLFPYPHILLDATDPGRSVLPRGQCRRYQFRTSARFLRQGLSPLPTFLPQRRTQSRNTDGLLATPMLEAVSSIGGELALGLPRRRDKSTQGGSQDAGREAVTSTICR